MLIYQKDSAPFDELSSPNYVSDMVIISENKNPRQMVYEHLSGSELGVYGRLEQI